MVDFYSSRLGQIKAFPILQKNIGSRLRPRKNKNKTKRGTIFYKEGKYAFFFSTKFIIQIDIAWLKLQITTIIIAQQEW